MKKNNFFKVALLAAAALSGISFETRAMENKTLMIVAGLGTAAFVSVLLVKKSGTYKTYNEHQTRLLEEKQKSDNPLLDAQPLLVTEVNSKGISGDEKLAAFLKQDEKIRNAYNQRTEKNEIYWENVKFIDSYEPDKK